MKDVIAIAVADLHLSQNPPIARVGEKSWFDAMQKPLNDLSDLAHRYHCPILCAGDVFDRWSSGPELINFALEFLPEMFAIPGQHDLPNHNIADIKRSAFWTLVKAKKITIVASGGPNKSIFHQFALQGFAWNVPIQPPDFYGPTPVIALVHAYTWKAEHHYQDAPMDQNVLQQSKKYKGYNTVIIGDNHISWDWKIKGLHVFNCGGFYRRNSDQINHRPRVGLIHSDGSVTSHYLDCSKDVLTPIDAGPQSAQIEGMANFLMELKSIQGASLDYAENLIQVMESSRVSAKVRKIILDALNALEKK